MRLEVEDDGQFVEIRLCRVHCAWSGASTCTEVVHPGLNRVRTWLRLVVLRCVQSERQLHNETKAVLVDYESY